MICSMPTSANFTASTQISDQLLLMVLQLQSASVRPYLGHVGVLMGTASICAPSLHDW